MGVATGCVCKEVYRFPHTTYPYSSCICSFLQQHPYFLFIKKKCFSFFYINKVGNNVYCQTIGIHMVTNCAPQLVNVFLFHYEYLYMKKQMHDNLCMAKRFSDTVRYIDDLLTLNNSYF